MYEKSDYIAYKSKLCISNNNFSRLPKQSVLRERLLRFDEKSKTRNDGIIKIKSSSFVTRMYEKSDYIAYKSKLCISNKQFFNITEAICLRERLLRFDEKSKTRNDGIIKLNRPRL